MQYPHQIANFYYNPHVLLKFVFYSRESSIYMVFNTADPTTAVFG